MVKNNLLGVKESTNGLFHLVVDGFYVCNRAVGVHGDGLVDFDEGVVTCKCCLHKLKNY